MTSVVPEPPVASAYLVRWGNYGDVRRYAQQRGVCRQRVYREATWLHTQWTRLQQDNQRLRQQVRTLTQQQAQLQARLAMAVVLDEDKQAEFAGEGQARGVSLAILWALLEVLRPGQHGSVATLGRRTQAAADKAGPLLHVLDEVARDQVREAAADELYVNAPVRMVVEPDSLCWLAGRLGEDAQGEGWAQELQALPNLEQVARDGGKGLQKGVALVNAQRQAAGQAPLVDQGDHWHALRGAGVGLRKAQAQASKALAAAEEAQQQVEECQRQGQPSQGPARHANALWRQAEQALDAWSALEQTWCQTKQALQLLTPAGTLNTRAQAAAVLAQTLPQLPDGAFAKTKRQLQKPELLNYLDHVQRQLAALPFPEAVTQAALRQESLRRQPQQLAGANPQAAARRGVLLVAAVVLSQAGEAGEQAVSAVRDILRRAYRASSLVECINSVLRMQQARHRKLTQGLLDLKRLYWNCHTFRTGRRRGTTPYQRLGIGWPEGLRWWDVLKLTPEQLRDKLSTAKKAA
jgi:hypothetical protein